MEEKANYELLFNMCMESYAKAATHLHNLAITVTSIILYINYLVCFKALPFDFLAPSGRWTSETIAVWDERILRALWPGKRTLIGDLGNLTEIQRTNEAEWPSHS